MSFAAYQVLSELFPEQIADFNEVMAELGFNPAHVTADVTTPAGIGILSAAALMEVRREDGSNQLGGYADTTGYIPVNTPDNLVDMERWTAERIPIDSSDGPFQQFLTPQWGMVDAFSFDAPDQFRSPAPQPFLLVDDATVDYNAKTIILADGSVVPISPDLVGTIINPEFITQAEEVVHFSANLTDEQKLIAEFWEDPGGTAFPPGTWMTFGQFVSARDDNSLDQDVELFFTLGNAVFDAGITTWEAKLFYDYERPVRAIRNLGELGLIGEFNEELGGFAIDAWGSPEQGTQTILANDFITYQTPGKDPSPPFAEYTSGHSSFSAAGATVLELLTGSNSFGAAVTFEPGSSRFEPDFTPQAEVMLAWDTFSAAADEAGLSRLYGGIHFTEGDINGRILGQEVGAAVFEATQFFINGGQEQSFLIGTRDTDFLIGNADDEQIYGGSGHDLLVGRRGHDSIFGGDGHDILWGGKGDDVLSGDAGNDILYGGYGDDTYKGGQGVDQFVLTQSGGVDTIIDFEVGIDIIVLGKGLHPKNVRFFELETGTLVLANGSNRVLGFVEEAINLDSTDFGCNLRHC